MRLTVSAALAAAVAAAACTPPAEDAASGENPAAGSERPVDGVGVMQESPVGASTTVQFNNGQGQPAGTATLSQGPRGVVMRIEATGLTPGWHGLHFHAVGLCEGPGFQSAGSHIVPGEGEAVHGLLNAEQNDAGDLPNLYADAQGRAFAEIYTPAVRLADRGEGEPLLDADGSALLIHANADDHQSQPIGGAGDRVACGTIGGTGAAATAPTATPAAG